MNQELTLAIDDFCASNDAVVFCDHTSGYYGKYKVVHSISSSQTLAMFSDIKPDLTIHIGEITGDYSCGKIIGNSVWRVSEDGDTFRKLQYVFQMTEIEFFKYYAKDKNKNSENYLNSCKNHLEKLYKEIPEIPFSNLWVAKQSHKIVPNTFWNIK